jgi:hypothetical protein
MARPERHDADYFPFYAKDGKTLFILESKYQCKGTGFFTNVMRFLTLEKDHHFCIKAPEDRLYFFSKCKCDDVSGADMLDMMSVTGKIDKELWVSSAVIVSQDLLTSLSDAYRKRLNPIITIAEIREKYVSGGINGNSTGINQVNGGDKPQRKGKERKGKETKINKPFIPPTLEEAKAFFKERGYKESIAEKAWSGYDVADWYNSKGKKVQNWKQTFIQVWFTDENRAPQEYQQPPLEEVLY